MKYGITLKEKGGGEGGMNKLQNIERSRPNNLQISAPADLKVNKLVNQRNGAEKIPGQNKKLANVKYVLKIA